MKKTFLIIFGIVLALGFLWSIKYFVSKTTPKELAFANKKAKIMDITKDTRATGSVVPREEVEVKSQVSGIISKIFVEPGDYVKTGQLIAQIKIIPDMATLSNAESRVEKARVAKDNAERVYNRQKELLNEGVIAQADLDNFELTYLNAVEEHRAAQEALQIIRDGVASSSSNATNTLIRATITGTVLDVPVEVGKSVIESNTFNDGTTIASIANMDDLIFKGTVDEAEVGKIRVGMPLELSIGALQGDTILAELEYISPKGVEENGAIQFEIKAGLKEIDSIPIRAGYSANASIVLDRKEKVVSIEESLLKFDEKTNKPYVEVMTSAGVYKKKELVVGLSDGINIEVKKGLDTTAKVKVWNESDDLNKNMWGGK